MRRTLLTIVAFFIVSFVVQGLWHFKVNADHFATISFMRATPVFPLGFAAMIIEALVFSFVMTRLWPNGATILQGVAVSACFGLFLASYIALAEPAKYAAPSIQSWIIIEGTASFIQFSIFGFLLGLIYRRKDTA